MKIIKDSALFIQQLSPRNLFHLILTFLALTAMTALGIIYITYSRSNDFIAQIKKIESLALKSNAIIAEYNLFVEEQERLKALFTQDQKFDIKIFFEDFCKEQSISATKGWGTTSKDITNNISEITLSASFKGLTMEKLVKILDAIEKKEIIYVKELVIKNDDNKQISCDIKLATTSYKRKTE